MNHFAVHLTLLDDKHSIQTTLVANFGVLIFKD